MSLTEPFSLQPSNGNNADGEKQTLLQPSSKHPQNQRFLVQVHTGKETWPLWGILLFAASSRGCLSVSVCIRLEYFNFLFSPF